MNESKRKWVLNNYEKKKEIDLRWRNKNKHKRVAATKEWGLNNLEKRRQYNRDRKRRIKLATPLWANKTKIRAIYKNRPKGFVVDHIYPLVGKNFSGLHVEHNLQYLTREENCRKYNLMVNS